MVDEDNQIYDDDLFVCGQREDEIGRSDGPASRMPAIACCACGAVQLPFTTPMAAGELYQVHVNAFDMYGNQLLDVQGSLTFTMSKFAAPTLVNPNFRAPSNILTTLCAQCFYGVSKKKKYAAAIQLAWTFNRFFLVAAWGLTLSSRVKHTYNPPVTMGRRPEGYRMEIWLSVRYSVCL